MPTRPTRVLILGGGFGGVYAAIHLERGLRRSERTQVEISLVSRDNYLVFQPMLPEVVSGALETLHVIGPIRRLARRTRLITRQIEGIDLDARTVRLAPGFRPRLLELSFDHLVLALGTRLDCDKTPGAREHAFAFKYLGDALPLRNHVVRALEEADIEADAAERQKLLTFVVAGGGFSGVECAAELNDFVRDAVKAYQNLRSETPRVVLLQSGDRILPELTPGLAEYAQRILRRRGVELQLKSRLAGVTADAAYVTGPAGETAALPTRTTVATVPAGSHPLLATLPCEQVRGRLRVDEHLRVCGKNNVWAIGDCAAVPQADGGISPPTAQHAIRQAKTCAANILAEIRGTPPERFTFTGLGKLGSLGRRSAVAEVLGVKLSGFPAWILWRAIYLAKFPGWDRKIRVLTDWILDLFLPRDITQVRLGKDEGLTQEHFETGETVFEQGDWGTKVFFVVKGRADVFIDGHLVRSLGTGDVFGEIALLRDAPRTARITAGTPLDVVSVSREAFAKLLAHVPGVRQSMDASMREHLTTAADGERGASSTHAIDSAIAPEHSLPPS